MLVRGLGLILEFAVALVEMLSPVSNEDQADSDEVIRGASEDTIVLFRLPMIGMLGQFKRMI